MRLFAIALCGIAFSIAVPAAAQTVGTQVTDATGGPVGTVSAVQGDNFLIKTDKHEVLLPKSSFTPADGKLLFGMTQVQLDAEIEKGLAAADASIKAGATVKGVQGTALGTIDAADAESVTIKLTSGQLVRIARSGVRGNVDGSVTVGVTAEQLEAQVGTGAPAASEGQ